MELLGSWHEEVQVIRVVAPRIDAAVAIRFKDEMRQLTLGGVQVGERGAGMSADRPDSTGGSLPAPDAASDEQAATRHRAQRIVLDLSEVEFVDSSGLGAIVAAMKQLEEGRRLDLAGLTPLVERVFRLTRLDTVFRIHPDLEEALARDPME